MERKQILLFFQRLAILIFIVITVDRIGGYALKTLYFSQKKGQFSQITYSLDSTKHDILIFGSSRAIRHYASDILVNSLGKSVYNVGMDGQMIPYYSALQEVILARYNPEMIILDINPWELNRGEAKYHKLSALLPYVEESPELLKYVSYASDMESIKLYSKIYPYNSSLFIGLYNLILKNRLPNYINGYLPLERVMNYREYKDSKDKFVYEAKAEEKQKDVYDLRSIDLLRQFLKKAEERDIKVMVIISPAIFSNSFNDTKLQKLKGIVAEYPNIAFFDYSKDKDFIDHYELFADVFHLNKAGAKVFTTKLANIIKSNRLNTRVTFR